MGTTYAAVTEPAEDAADFYIGQGKGAEYLGTVEQLGDLAELTSGGVLEPPDGQPWTEHAFREAVAEQIRQTGGSTSWPWAHPDSTSTPWAYCLIGGHTVHVWRRGRLAGALYPGWRSGPARPRRSATFPRLGPVNAE